MGAESITLITARVSKTERGSGGTPEITEAEICHALALINAAGPALLLRVKIAGQERYRTALTEELIRRRWHSKHKRYISGLAYIAVNEYCAQTLCKTCNGRESHKAGDLLIVCPVCNGSGKYRHSDPAEQLGLNLGQWRALEGTYSDMLGSLSVWEDIGIEAINSIRDDSLDSDR